MCGNTVHDIICVFHIPLKPVAVEEVPIAIRKIKTENSLIFSDLRRIIRLQENKNEKTVFRGGLPMKILRITAQGLPLFKKDLDICFYTQQRVCETSLIKKV